MSFKFFSNILVIFSFHGTFVAYSYYHKIKAIDIVQVLHTKKLTLISNVLTCRNNEFVGDLEKNRVTSANLTDVDDSFDGLLSSVDQIKSSLTDVDDNYDLLDFEFIAAKSTDSDSKSALELSTIPDSNSSLKQLEPSKSNGMIALISGLLGVILFVINHSQPAVSGVALLRMMEADSPSLKEAICNSKPTIIDFYAPWCTSCKELAPDMRYIEKRFGNSINVVTLDAMKSENGGLVSKFKVDGIPHLAFLDKDSNVCNSAIDIVKKLKKQTLPRLQVITALIGAVPKSLLLQDVNALIEDTPLPVVGYDAFKEVESRNPFNLKACTID